MNSFCLVLECQHQLCYMSGIHMKPDRMSTVTSSFTVRIYYRTFRNRMKHCDLFRLSQLHLNCARSERCVPPEHTSVCDFVFDVLLTVHLSIFVSVINQLAAQHFCFTISLIYASTCFEQMCSSSGGENCITQPLVSSHRLMHRLRKDVSPLSTCTRDGHL